jgi:hypothetical protein
MVSRELADRPDGLVEATEGRGDMRSGYPAGLLGGGGLQAQPGREKLPDGRVEHVPDTAFLLCRDAARHWNTGRGAAEGGLDQRGMIGNGSRHQARGDRLRCDSSAACPLEPPSDSGPHGALWGLRSLDAGSPATEAVTGSRRQLRRPGGAGGLLGGTQSLP